MMSRKEYMYWQNRKDRVSEYICVRAIFLVFNSFIVKNFNFFTIHVKFKVILSSKSGGGGGDICAGHPPTIHVKFKVIVSSKSGGIFVQAIPPPKKWGRGDTSPPPIPPGFTPVSRNIIIKNFHCDVIPRLVWLGFEIPYRMWREFCKFFIPAGSAWFLLIPNKCDGGMRLVDGIQILIVSIRGVFNFMDMIWWHSCLSFSVIMHSFQKLVSDFFSNFVH